MKRYYEKITHEDLATKILNAFEAEYGEPELKDWYETYCNADVVFVNDMAAILSSDGNGIPWHNLSHEIGKDIRDHCDFDLENVNCQDGEESESIIGFKSEGNLNFLGLTAGGDWEQPVFFMIYWDGVRIRAYVPYNGNPFNTSNNSPYGNATEEMDLANLKERVGYGKATDLTNLKARVGYGSIDEKDVGWDGDSMPLVSINADAIIYDVVNNFSERSELEEPAEIKCKVRVLSKMSEEGQAIFNEIEYVEERISKLKNVIKGLKKRCSHELKVLSEKDMRDKWMSVGADCMICGSDWGWRCKNSPDSVCHYYSGNGKVEMIDGTEVDVPENHDSEYENEDECIFCGHPDERK